MDIKETAILGDKISQHWYYRSKAKAMTRMLAQANIPTILDVGAGSGFFSRYLLTNSAAKEAWCLDINYDADSDILEAGKPIHFRRSVDALEANLVLLMDVLEHVDNDVELLSDCIHRVPPGALFLISVPAFEFLWSGHDVFLEHRRRYTLRQIEDVARKAGLTVKQGHYYFGAVFPLAATTRLMQKLFYGKKHKPHSQLKQHHPIINNTLSFLCQRELPLMPLNRLYGLSAFCLAQAPSLRKSMNNQETTKP